MRTAESKVKESSYLLFPAIQFHKIFRRFLGCIKDLGYGEGTYIGPPRMIEAEYVDQREVCMDACQPGSKCMNGGKCRNLFFEFACDCLGTGYEGKHCENS